MIPVTPDDVICASLTYRPGSILKPLIPKAQKVDGMWDKIISSIAPRNAVTNNRNIVFLPQVVEKFFGDYLYEYSINSFGGNSFNVEKTELVKLVKDRLFPHLRREFDWDIQLVSSKSMNASALPGGKIIICEGIIDEMVAYLRTHIEEIQPGLRNQPIKEQCERLGEELQSMVAAVISHEIAHADIGHGRKALQLMLIFNILLYIGYFLASILALGASNDTSNKTSSILKMVAQFFHDHLLNLSFRLYQLAQSRGSEYEADAMGMQVYMYEAGYDLIGAVRVMDMFGKKQFTNHPRWGLIQTLQEKLSTHPLSSLRKKQAEEIRDRVLKGRVVVLPKAA